MRKSDIAGIIVAVVAIPGALVYLYERAAAAPHPMDDGDLVRTTRQLASDAREAARLAKLSGKGQVNEHYARTQHEKIAEDVHDAIKALAAPPPRGREEDARRAVSLATEMKTALDQSPSHLADPGAMQKLEDEHASIAAELERIASK